MNTILISPIKRSSDAELSKISARVISNVKGAANLFAAPDPTIAELEKANDDYNASLIEAGSRNRTEMEIKNQKKAILIALLTRLAAYISFVAKNDRAILLASGFEISAERSAPITMPEVLGFAVKSDNTGEAFVEVQKIPGVKSYMYQYTAESPTPQTLWASENSLRRRHTFTKLKSDVRHWFRVVALGTGNQLVYAKPVSKVID